MVDGHIEVSGGADKLWSNECYSLEVLLPGLKNAIVDSILDDFPASLIAMAYPNPNDGNFTLQVNAPGNGIAVIELFSSIGQQLDMRKVKLIKGSTNRIEYRSMAHGLLFYRIQLKDKVITGQIIAN